MTSLTEEKLKPCPFCGKSPTEKKDDCPCGAFYQLKTFLDQDIDDWNSAYCWKQLSEREAVIAEREAEIKSLEWQMSKRLVDKLSFDEFETLRKEKDSEIAALKSKLGEAEKALKLADKLRDSLDGQDLAAIRSQSNSFLNINAAFLDYAHIRGKQFLRTPSDGEGKS